MARYQKLYDGVTKIEDKIQLEDRIFNQERKIDYLEQRLNSVDERVKYTTLSVSLREKPSKYADATVTGFSNLVTI